MLSVPNICFILFIVVTLAWIAFICHVDTDRPKPFDYEGWDNGLAKVNNKS